MTVEDLADKFGLDVAAGHKGLNKNIYCCYCGDLLSDVMGNAPTGCVWLTVQGNPNILAVALIREMAAIIIVGRHEPDPETKIKADQEGIPVLLWPGAAFDFACRLHDLGIVGSETVKE